MSVPVDRGDGRHVLLVAHVVLQQSVPDLPREHRRVLPLVLADVVHHLGRGHFRLRPAYDSRLDGPSLVVPASWGEENEPG